MYAPGIVARTNKRPAAAASDSNDECTSTAAQQQTSIDLSVKRLEEVKKEEGGGQ